MKEVSSPKVWESKKEMVLARDYFEFQLKFAKKLSELTGKPLNVVIQKLTSFLRQDDRAEEFVPGVNENNADLHVKNKFEESRVKSEKAEPTPYHEEFPENQGARFGCFYYTFNSANPQSIDLHFANAEYSKQGPLTPDKIPLRKKELADLLKDVKSKLPQVELVRGVSWLYSLKHPRALERIFPKAYVASRQAGKSPSHWQTGAVWGQFIDSEYKLNQSRAAEFENKIDQLKVEGVKTDEELNGQLFNALPMPPTRVEGPIDEFYEMYGI
jgi:hypothetical protein